MITVIVKYYHVSYISLAYSWESKTATALCTEEIGPIGAGVMREILISALQCEHAASGLSVGSDQDLPPLF